MTTHLHGFHDNLPDTTRPLWGGYKCRRPVSHTTNPRNRPSIYIRSVQTRMNIWTGYMFLRSGKDSMRTDLPRKKETIPLKVGLCYGPEKEMFRY